MPFFELLTNIVRRNLQLLRLTMGIAGFGLINSLVEPYLLRWRTKRLEVPELLEATDPRLISNILIKAKREVRVCMTRFTYRNFALILDNLARHHGVKVRVILDGALSEEPTSLKRFLQFSGIEVRCSPPTEHMVNSYCLVDTGNPGQAGFVFENRDEIPPQGIVLTSIACWDETLESLSRPKVLKLVTEVVINIFHNEFEELWQRFAPPQ